MTGSLKLHLRVSEKRKTDTLPRRFQLMLEAATVHHVCQGRKLSHKMVYKHHRALDCEGAAGMWTQPWWAVDTHDAFYSFNIKVQPFSLRLSWERQSEPLSPEYLKGQTDKGVGVGDNDVTGAITGLSTATGKDTKSWLMHSERASWKRWHLSRQRGLNPQGWPSASMCAHGHSSG